MKVCAHFNVAPFEHYHERFSTMDAAKRHLQENGRFDSFSHGERPSVWLAPQCKECWDNANFHEFAVIYELGPRGGLRRLTY
jgi:hypothetical protein